MTTNDRQEAQTANMRLASCGVKCLNSSSVFQFGFSAGLTVWCFEIPHERQAQKRYVQKSKDLTSKSREMKVGLHANMVDMRTDKIGSSLRDVFVILCERLSGNYGGTIEHLWIDFELIESHAKPDGKPRYPFRFTKRVSGRSSFGLPPTPDNFNVGHFSVRPDFQRLLSIANEEVIPYCLNLIYKELEVLKTKEKKLGGFDSELFRKKYVDECTRLGYYINPN